MQASQIFEENYQHYCDQLATVDFNSRKHTLGITLDDDDNMVLPFYNESYFVSSKGIQEESGKRANYMISVILCKYILLCPDRLVLDTGWATFKDFKRASHVTNMNYFSSDTEKIIEKHFTGRLDTLKKACAAFDGFDYEMDASYDLSMQFDTLPRISLLLLFNDGDDEFPARCNVLFHKHAEYYLDPESLAMTSGYLAKCLKKHI